MACVNTIGTYVFECAEGYTWNAAKCVATPNNPQGRCPGTAQNETFWVYPEDQVAFENGDFMNTNPSVYDADLGDECVDKNECLDVFTCPENSYCDNKDIAVDGIFYDCVCNTGFTETRDDNGVLISCEDIDECNGSLDGCSGPTQCVNTVGSYHCGCEAGFTIDTACQACIDQHITDLGDGTLADPFVVAGDPTSGPADPNQCVADAAAAATPGQCCYNINECEAVPRLDFCPSDSVCVDNEGSYFCDCVAQTEYIEEIIDPSNGALICCDHRSVLAIVTFCTSLTVQIYSHVLTKMSVVKMLGMFVTRSLIAQILIQIINASVLTATTVVQI